MPGGRRRNDARQGTIDQDPEFKEFLESLTAPLTKPAAPDADAQKEEKVKTTPLIEALREKKANKDKPQGKNKGRGDTKETAAEKKLLTKPGKQRKRGLRKKPSKLSTRKQLCEVGQATLRPTSLRHLLPSANGGTLASLNPCYSGTLA
jgi:regulator of nonsense transcripts 3